MVFEQFFHGARTCDAHSAASLLRERAVSPDQVLAGVGYSLGGIVLNKYLATYQEDAQLDVAVTISGALNCIHQPKYHRSKNTWQRMIAAHMKDVFMHGKWGRRLYHQLGQEEYEGLMRVQSVVVSLMESYDLSIESTFVQNSCVAVSIFP